MNERLKYIIIFMLVLSLISSIKISFNSLKLNQVLFKIEELQKELSTEKNQNK